jgi:NAD(P)-dependent dehydrogenase (short-subunit alcohol dehydrogenase family)
MSELEKLFGLGGRTALVTGASSGLGGDCARALAGAGADVGLVARRLERLDALASELRERGGRACAAPADVTVTQQLVAAFDRVEAELGPIDILVSAAGVSEISRALKHTRERWDRVVALNLTAAFEASQIMGRRLVDRGAGGKIIHISSVLGWGANPVYRAIGYAATKGGLNNLVRQLAMEWAEHDIQVNAIAPGYFPTEMIIDPKLNEVEPSQRERMEAFTPMGRLGRRGELDTALLFLSAPASSYVTGAIIPVDGGWSAW